MIWLAVNLSRMKPYRPLAGTPLSVGACVVTKTRFRVVYLTLTMTFALPLVLNLWTTFVANSWKRHWPYLALAAAFAVAALVRNELRRHPTTELGVVADRLVRSINEQRSAEAAARRINDPSRLPVPWKVVRERAFDPWSEVIELARRATSTDQQARPVPSVDALDNANGLAAACVDRACGPPDRRPDEGTRHRRRRVQWTFAVASPQRQ